MCKKGIFIKMKKIILTIFFVTAILGAEALYAKTADLGFRIGKVVAAEITTATPEIIGKESFPYPLPAKPVYAVVVLKMVQNRSLSSLDYSLIVNGTTTPCIAIVCNMAAFVCSPDATYPSEKDYARLLFILDGNKVKLPAAGKTLKGTLKTNLRGRGNVALNITSQAKQPFSDCTKIPEAGALK